MPTENPRTTVRVDRDGVRITETRGVRRGVWVIIAGVLVLTAVVLLRQTSHREASPPADSVRPPRVAQSAGHEARAPAAAANAPITRVERPQVDARRPNLPPRADSGSKRAAVDADEGGTDAKTAQEPSGIALFPPMGTDPIKRGILVPDDFELPPGYVRHHQVTDDGQPLPPILMFHPDFQPVDEHGEPLPIPADRVVPPDMAPPGLAVEMLEVPESEPDGAASEPDR